MTELKCTEVLYPVIGQNTIVTFQFRPRTLGPIERY